VRMLFQSFFKEASEHHHQSLRIYCTDGGVAWKKKGIDISVWFSLVVLEKLSVALYVLYSSRVLRYYTISKTIIARSCLD
jgi:hypothetical protein